MDMFNDPRAVERAPELYIDFIKKTGPRLALLALLVVQFSLWADAFDLTFFLKPYTGGPATSLATALAVTCIAVAVINATSERSRRLHHALLFLSLLITLMAEVIGSIRHEEGLFVDLNGQMGFDTYVAIALLAFANLFQRCFYKTGAVLLLLAFAVLFASLVEVSFGLPGFSGEMAFGTLIALICLFFATMTQFLDYAPLRVVFLNSSIGRITRSMVLVSTLVPWACGMVLYQYVEIPPRQFPVEALLITLIILSGVSVAVRAGCILEALSIRRQAALRQLEAIAVTDALTGLYNREGAKRLLRERRRVNRASGTDSAIVMMDIDHFKSINDRYGHVMGDMVLKKIQTCLGPFLREGEFIARWGGEEFLLNLDVTPEESLGARIEEMRQALPGLPKMLRTSLAERPEKVTASFGVSLWGSGERIMAAIARADAALYRAKRNGRNCAVFDGLCEEAAPRKQA